MDNFINPESFSDGLLDELHLGLDLNQDGVNDVELFASDNMGTNLPDHFGISVDWNSDGTTNAGLELDMPLAPFEPAHSAAWMDYNDDGQANVYASGADVTGDYFPDVPESLEISESTWDDITALTASTAFTVSELMFNGEPLFGSYDLDVESFQPLWETHGSPFEDLALWDQQDDPYSCAVATTNMMFRSIGLDVGETQLAEVLEAKDIYDPLHGSQIDGLSDVLNEICEVNDLDHQAWDFQWNSTADLADLLDSGARPLLALDATDLYIPFGDQLSEWGILPASGHAVQLIGIQEGPEGTIAILNDPDVGAGIEVSIEKLIDAAEDYGFKGVALS
jgi:hypothetical protein